MLRRIKKRGFKNPSITEFDYWVYQKWIEGKELVKNLIDYIPKEFNQSNLTRELRIGRISQSIQRLKNTGRYTMDLIKEERISDEKEY
ncbi:MAG: hypothetical protein QXO70_02260 [Candidatus Pacearchaeota archaeon]